MRGMHTVNGFVQQTAAFVRAHALWKEGDGIVLACSGGPDSLALADVLLRMRGMFRLRLVLAHFEHGIRGEASREDARFVRDWAREKGVPFECGSADIPALARASAQSLETEARVHRYAFLEQVRIAYGFQAIATAHHADDQAETVLLHLLRGAGTAGLAGIRPKSRLVFAGEDAAGYLVRPFLGVTKAEIAAYCVMAGLHPRHDATNDETDAMRNRVRLELMPQLKRYNPQITEALGRLSEVASDDQEALDAWASRVALPPRVEDLRRLPRAVARLVVRRYWRETTGSAQDLPFEAVNRVLRLAAKYRNSGLEQLPHHAAAVCQDGYCIIQISNKRKEEQ